MLSNLLGKRHIKIIASASLLIVGLCGFAYFYWPQSPPSIALIEAPCNTFVTEFAPVPTPVLRSVGENLELMVSFTPAKDREADEIISAVTMGTKNLVVGPDRYSLTALRVEKGRLVLAIKSKEDAQTILEKLCFQKPTL